MLNPLSRTTLMSDSQNDKVFLHQLYGATRDKSSSVAIRSAITELLNDIDAVLSISEPAKTLAEFLHDYATKSLTPFDTFVDCTTERYTGTVTDLIFQKTPPRLSKFTIDELDNPAYRWLILFDQRFELALANGLLFDQAALYASITAPIEDGRYYRRRKRVVQG